MTIKNVPKGALVIAAKQDHASERRHVPPGVDDPQEVNEHPDAMLALGRAQLELTLRELEAIRANIQRCFAALNLGDVPAAVELG